MTTQDACRTRKKEARTGDQHEAKIIQIKNIAIKMQSKLEKQICSLLKMNNPIFDTSSLQDCARLVFSTYPNRKAAAAMLAVIKRNPQAPKKGEILALVAEMLKTGQEGDKN